MVEITQEIKFEKLSNDKKEFLLSLLGHSVDSEGFVIENETKERIKCRYTKDYIPLKTASVFPGSTIIINTSPYTISCYISEFLAKDSGCD